MTAINFPDNPTIGQSFTAADRTWIWDGTVWNNSGEEAFPPQSGNAGKFLSTDGSTTSWQAVDALPDQTGNSGKYLTTDGTDASWGTVDLSSKQDVVSGVSSTEIGYLDGVTSSIQNQINSKADIASPTFTGNVTLPSTTSIGNVSSTEIGYLDGVTSSIQTQLNGKAATSHTHTKSQITDFAHTHAISDVTNLQTTLDGKASLSGATFTGSVNIASIAALSIQNPEGGLFVDSWAKLGTIFERTTLAGAFAGYTHYVLPNNSSVVFFEADSTSNGIINITRSSSKNLSGYLAPGETMTVTFLIKNGATAYYPTAINIDGLASNIKWLGGTAPSSGNINAIDAYTITIIGKTDGSFFVIGSAAKFS